MKRAASSPIIDVDEMENQSQDLRRRLEEKEEQRRACSANRQLLNPVLEMPSSSSMTLPTISTTSPNLLTLANAALNHHVSLASNPSTSITPVPLPGNQAQGRTSNSTQTALTSAFNKRPYLRNGSPPVPPPSPSYNPHVPPPPAPSSTNHYNSLYASTGNYLRNRSSGEASPIVDVYDLNRIQVNLRSHESQAHDRVDFFARMVQMNANILLDMTTKADRNNFRVNRATREKYLILLNSLAYCVVTIRNIFNGFDLK